MMHHRRTWAVKTYSEIEVLARDLVMFTWTPCMGFRFEGLLFLNDATCDDGTFECAVVVEATGKEIETVSYGWFCDFQGVSGDEARKKVETDGIAKAVASIRMCLDLAKQTAAKDLRTDWGARPTWRPRIEEAENHETCDLCA